MAETPPTPSFRHLFRRWLLFSICLPTGILIAALSIAVPYSENAFYDSASIPRVGGVRLLCQRFDRLGLYRSRCF